MINEVLIDTSRMTAGERRSIIVRGDQAVYMVEIRCFYRRPPPGEFRPCGQLTIANNEVGWIKPHYHAGEDADLVSAVQIEVTDPTGAVWKSTIAISVATTA